MGTVSFPGVKNVQDVTLTPHTLLVPWSRKGRAIPLLPLWAVRLVQSLSVCTRVHFTFYLEQIGIKSFLVKVRSSFVVRVITHTHIYRTVWDEYTVVSIYTGCFNIKKPTVFMC
jgi:hypothetical protein